MATQPYNQARAEMPTTMLLNDMRLLHNEMADLILAFNSVCERLEKCAVQLKEMNLVNNREMFQAFFDRGIIPGKLIRFVDNPDTSAIYEVTGMDGEGFFIRRFPFGDERKLRVMEEYDRCRAMRTIKESSSLVQKALREADGNADLLPSSRRQMRLAKDGSGSSTEESFFDSINENDKKKLRILQKVKTMQEYQSMSEEQIAAEQDEYREMDDEEL